MTDRPAPDRRHWIDRPVRALALLGGVVLLGLMGLTVVDVTARYVFNAPIFGGQDVAELMLLAVAACSFAYCGRTGGHVAVEIFSTGRARALTRWMDPPVKLASAAILAVLAWRCGVAGLAAMSYDEASNLLEIPYWPFYWLLAGGFAVYALVLLIEATDLLRGDKRTAPRR